MEWGIATEMERVKALEVMKNVKSIRGPDEVGGCEITIENAPVGEFQSNGVVENVMKRVHGQMKTIQLPYGRAL